MRHRGRRGDQTVHSVELGENHHSRNSIARSCPNSFNQFCRRGSVARSVILVRLVKNALIQPLLTGWKVGGRHLPWPVSMRRRGF